MSNKKHEVEFVVVHQVHFSCGFEAVVYAIRRDIEQANSIRDIVPAFWSLDSDIAHGGDSSVTFESDEPFKEEELLKVQRRIQLLVDAYEAMAKGTNAA